jgi:hypothetical protein
MEVSMIRSLGFGVALLVTLAACSSSSSTSPTNDGGSKGSSKSSESSNSKGSGGSTASHASSTGKGGSSNASSGGGGSSTASSGGGGSLSGSSTCAALMTANTGIATKETPCLKDGGTAQGILPVGFTVADCDQKIGACTAANLVMINAALDCVDALPTCSPSTASSWGQSVEACLSGDAGTLSSACAEALGQTPPSSDAGMVDAG